MVHMVLSGNLWLIFLVASLLPTGKSVELRPRNCPEAFEFGSPGPGEKTLYTSSGIPFKCYCHFYTDGRTHAFLHTEALTNDSTLDLDVELLRDNTFNSLLMFSLKNKENKWKRAWFRLLSDESTEPAIMRNTYAGYKSPEPTHNPNNYLYIGFYNLIQAGSLSVQGVNVQVRDCSYNHCGNDTSSYIALYPDQGGAEPLNDTESQLLDCILGSLSSSPIRLPTAGYKMYGQISFGGCGAATTSDRLDDFDGMALGFRHSYSTCGNPGVPPNSIRTGDGFGFGNNVTYECMPGTIMTGGSKSRTCEPVTGWSGSSITCASSRSGYFSRVREVIYVETSHLAHLQHQHLENEHVLLIIGIETLLSCASVCLDEIDCHWFYFDNRKQCKIPSVAD